MNKKVLGVFVSLLVVAMLALPMSAAYATKPMPVSGSFIVTPSPPKPPNFAGKSDNNKATPESTITFTGDIVGTAAYSGRWVMHNYGDPANLVINARDSYVVEATVDGKSGTLYIEATSRFRLGPNKPGRWRIIGGTGDLANLHGQGTFTPVTMFTYDYVGQVHFDP